MRSIAVHPPLLAADSSDQHLTGVPAGGGRPCVGSVDFLDDVAAGDGLELETVERRARGRVQRDRGGVGPEANRTCTAASRLSEQRVDEPRPDRLRRLAHALEHLHGDSGRADKVDHFRRRNAPREESGRDGPGPSRALAVRFRKHVHATCPEPAQPVPHGAARVWIEHPCADTQGVHARIEVEPQLLFGRIAGRGHSVGRRGKQEFDESSVAFVRPTLPDGRLLIAVRQLVDEHVVHPRAQVLAVALPRLPAEPEADGAMAAGRVAAIAERVPRSLGREVDE